MQPQTGPMGDGDSDMVEPARPSAKEIKARDVQVDYGDVHTIAMLLITIPPLIARFGDLYGYLCLPDYRLKLLRAANPTEPDLLKECLNEWISRESGKATWAWLKKALEKCESQDSANKIDELFRKKYMAPVASTFRANLTDAQGLKGDADINGEPAGLGAGTGILNGGRLPPTVDELGMDDDDSKVTITTSFLSISSSRSEEVLPVPCWRKYTRTEVIVFSSVVVAAFLAGAGIMYGILYGVHKKACDPCPGVNVTTQDGFLDSNTSTTTPTTRAPVPNHPATQPVPPTEAVPPGKVRNHPQWPPIQVLVTHPERARGRDCGQHHSVIYELTSRRIPTSFRYPDKCVGVEAEQMLDYVLLNGTSILENIQLLTCEASKAVNSLTFSNLTVPLRNPLISCHDTCRNSSSMPLLEELHFINLSTEDSGCFFEILQPFSFPQLRRIVIDGVTISGQNVGPLREIIRNSVQTLRVLDLRQLQSAINTAAGILTKEICMQLPRDFTIMTDGHSLNAIQNIRAVEECAKFLPT